MNFKFLDLFSQQFQFNVQQKQGSKRSTIGAVLSIIAISLSIAYFIYLLFLYLGNQIDAKYKSQTFISDESIKVDFHNDFVGFRFEYAFNKPIQELEQETGKKYLTFVSFLEIPSPNGTIPIYLDIIRCKSKYLEGYSCLDLSKVSNQTLENNNLENIYKQIVILVYRCADTDLYKNDIPNNCASDQEIDIMLAKVESRFRMKMFTSQYNTISEQIQTSYKNIIQYINPSEFLLATFKCVKQITKIKKGPFIQEQTEFSSPIDYISEPRIFNRQITVEALKFTMQIYARINVAEQYQQIYIQYPTFMEILAICNSTITLIMGVGIIGRYFAKQLIREDISLLLLQNIYQSQYLKSLKKLNILQHKQQEQEINNERKLEDVIENTQSVFIPSFLVKSKEIVETNKINIQDSPTDFILEQNKTQLQQLNFVNKDTEENTIDESEFNSERIKLNFLIQNTANIGQNNQQLIANYQQSKQNETCHQTQQKKRFHKDIQQTQSNKKEIFDRSTKDNLKQLKFGLHRKGSKFNLISPKHSQTQFFTSTSQNNCNKDQNQFQEISNKQLENLKAIQDKSFGKRVKKILFKTKCCEKECEQKNSVFDQIFKKTLNKQVDKSLDILQLYKDLLILKKAIMVILSKDQYAAIQLIGCSGTHQSQLIASQDEINFETTNTKIDHGYLDDQFMISESFQKQVDYINIFLQRWQNNQNLSEIDKRIFYSLSQV